MGARVVQAPSHPLACDTSHPLQGSPDHKSSPIVDRSIGALPSPQPPTPLHHPPPSSLPSQSTPEPNQPSSQSSAQRPQPPPKLTLCPTMSSNGLTPELANALDRLQPSLSPSNPQPSTRRGLWGMFGEAQPSRSSARSPDLDLDSLSVRSDDSGESSWTDMGDSISVATEGDASIGEGLFRVERDNDSRLGGVSPCLEVAEEVMGEGGSLTDNEPAERLVSVLTIHLGRLAALEAAREEVRVLRSKLAREEMRAKEEEEKAKVAGMEKAQAEGRVDGLVKEKRSLLDTLKYLQEELLKSGKK